MVRPLLKDHVLERAEHSEPIVEARAATIKTIGSNIGDGVANLVHRAIA